MALWLGSVVQEGVGPAGELQCLMRGLYTFAHVFEKSQACATSRALHARLPACLLPGLKLTD